MNDNEEEKEYGQMNPLTMSASILKDKEKNKVSNLAPHIDYLSQGNKFKSIEDFKIRALDFIDIYIREMKKKESHDNKFNSIDIIKGLLKAFQVAHQDKNTILFDRIKVVITNMAKGTHANKGDESHNKNGQE